jgi:hypothetical protein
MSDFVPKSEALSMIAPVQFNYLRQQWTQSRLFRWILLVTFVYALARLVVQAIAFVYMLSQAGPTGADTTLISNDLQVYLAAASRLVNRQDLYLQEALDVIIVYQYAPSYALLFSVFLKLPFSVIALLHSLLNIAAYVLLYFWWGRIFHRLGLGKANVMLAWTLPLWVLFTTFWVDLFYLNIYVITAFLCTLLIEAVLEERLGWSVLWLAIIMQTKPYLAFPLVISLILGRPRFFFKLLGLSVVAYAAIVAGTSLAVGPDYGWQQHVNYVRFLGEMTANFPWRGPDSDFLGYNHSILQIIYYYGGITPHTARLATIIKVLLLIPLAVACLRHFLRPAGCPGKEASQLALTLAFALYTGAFIWLDIMWELTLGLVIFAFLLSTLEHQAAKIGLSAVFLPYVLLDIWQVLTLVVLGTDGFTDDYYVWTDPSIYLPVVMIVTLAFYIVLVRQLFLIPTGQGLIWDKTKETTNNFLSQKS